LLLQTSSVPANACDVAKGAVITTSSQGAAATPIRVPHADIDFDKEAVKRAFLDKLFYIQGKFPQVATLTDYYLALAYTVRDLMLRRWVSTATAYTQERSRTVCYLSAEYLLGPHLGNNLINLGIYDQVRTAVLETGTVTRATATCGSCRV
jgi:starch phosphorylase